MQPSPRVVALVLAVAPLACAEPSGDPAAAAGSEDAGSSGAADDAGTDASTGGGLGPTFYEDVAPILYEHCVRCHGGSPIAPFELVEYDDAVLWSAATVAAAGARTMPPINADASGACNDFRDHQWLTDDEIATLVAWVEADTPPGDPAAAPPVPEPMPNLVDPDRVLDTGVDYTPVGADDYRCFVVDPGLDADAFLTAYQVVPGNTAVAHHLILFAVEDPADVEAVTALDAADDGPGYTCFGGPGVDGAQFVAGWAPGVGITAMPEGTGIPLVAGRPMVVQMHYNTASGDGTDRTTIALQIADTVDRPGRFVGVANHAFSLPAGMPLVETSITGPVPGDGTIEIWGVAPHMHTRGRTMRVSATTAAGDVCLVDVPRWDFSWQSAYFYERPVVLNGGDTVTLRCGFDTTGATGPTQWGESTDEEMCINYLYVVQ